MIGSGVGMTECGPIRGLSNDLRRVSAEGFLTQGGREDGWDSRVPEAMFSVTPGNPVSMRDNEAK